jgi:hypothetical protein
MAGGDEENNDAKREKMSKFTGFHETSKSARVHMNTHKYSRAGTKNQLDEGLDLGIGDN